MRFKEFVLEDIGFVLEVPEGRIGPAVADVQKVLTAMGYKLPKYGVDGIRGPETSGAIKKFQQDATLPTTGIPDQTTINFLNKLIKENPRPFAGLTKSTDADVKMSSGQYNIDTSTIQDPDFNRKLGKVADALGVKTSALLAVMKQESGVNPAAINRTSGATGLIQFMPTTAYKLGTSVEKLEKMSGVEQLDYVYKYYKMVGVRPGMDAGDLYVATFMPAALGKGDNHVLGAKNANGFSGAVYRQNHGLDRDGNGVITVADIKNSVNRFA